jgi:hypothetical protein
VGPRYGTRAAAGKTKKGRSFFQAKKQKNEIYRGNQKDESVDIKRGGSRIRHSCCGRKNKKRQEHLSGKETKKRGFFFLTGHSVIVSE